MTGPLNLDFVVRSDARHTSIVDRGRELLAGQLEARWQTHGAVSQEGVSDDQVRGEAEEVVGAAVPRGARARSLVAPLEARVDEAIVPELSVFDRWLGAGEPSWELEWPASPASSFQRLPANRTAGRGR